MTRKNKPMHPGEVLGSEFMVPLNVGFKQLAAKTDLPVEDLFSIIIGSKGIDTDIAAKLSKMFGTSPEFWLNLQKQYDQQTVK